ncbi:MAG: hypothetical protein E3J86_14500, partial [Candidatus Thorarchaeota archaeon]
MMVVVFMYFAWIFVSPINWVFGLRPLQFPSPLPLIIDTIVFVPLIWRFVRKWLEVMTRRSKGPAAGIDTVEPGEGKPEPGDEWGLATRPYSAQKETKVSGSKSEIRESPFGLEDEFFVKVPDIDTGEELFDLEKLRKRAMIRSRVSSGGWVKKRVSSRAACSLKSTDAIKYGRPIRSRMHTREIG